MSFQACVADVLPSGNFFEHQQADFVAGIEEVARLRVVRGADDVALELVAQNDRIAALGTAGHGLADEGEGLMPIESAQLDDFAVQLEAVIGELGFAEAEAAGVFVEELRSATQANASGVEIAVLEIPELDAAELIEVNGMRDRFGWRRRDGGSLLRGFGDDAVAIAQFDFERQMRLARLPDAE